MVMKIRHSFDTRAMMCVKDALFTCDEFWYYMNIFVEIIWRFSYHVFDI